MSAAIHEANFTQRILGHDHEPESRCAHVYNATSEQERSVGVCEDSATQKISAGNAATALQTSALQRVSQVEVGCTLPMPHSQHQQQPSGHTSLVQQSTPAQLHKQRSTQQSAQHGLVQHEPTSAEPHSQHQQRSSVQTNLVQQSTSVPFHEQRSTQQSAQQSLVQHQPASAQAHGHQHQHTWSQPEAEVSTLPAVYQPSQLQNMLQSLLSCSELADKRPCDLELVEQSGLGTIDAGSVSNTQQVCIPLITSNLCIYFAATGFAPSAQQVCLPPLCLS